MGFISNAKTIQPKFLYRKIGSFVPNVGVHQLFSRSKIVFVTSKLGILLFFSVTAFLSEYWEIIFSSETTY